MVFKTLVFIAFSALLGIAYSQSCTFDAIPEGAVDVEIFGLSETTPPDTILWSSPTENVVSAYAEASPLVKYINGLRYSSRYDYTASDLFSSFVTTERSELVERQVIFTCADNSQRAIHFAFHILDENNSPPEILDVEELRYSVKKSESGVPDGVDVIQEKAFRIRDMDLNEENALVTAMSSQKVFSAEATKDVEIDPVTFGHYFNVRLDIDWSLAMFGEYNFQIIVSDGKFSKAIPVVVDVYP